jgi:two-component SAPR family response regulator
VCGTVVDHLLEAEDPALSRSETVERYQTALALHKGSFLEEFYCDWATPRREELEMRVLHTTTRLAKLLAQSGSLEQAMELLHSAVVMDPFREEAHYSLIQCAALTGDRATALRRSQGVHRK